MSSPHSRRDVLKGAAALAAAASVGATTSRRAQAQGGAMQARTRIDGVLRQAVDAKEVPGVVAMAATDKGPLYEGAFGLRALDASATMTPDTVFRIASMTKAIASVAAMQLVEAGKLKLEEPVPNIDPALGSPQVLDGFDTAGAPRLRPAKRPITLRHLLTHTAGFSYDIWDANTGRYVKAAGMPGRATGKVASIRTPLIFDPGDKWMYGVSIDWVGRLVEAISGLQIEDYFRERIFAPLGMKDSGFVTTPEQRARQARVHTRKPDGELVPTPLEAPPVKGEFWSTGGPLYSTARDYLAFVQMLLHGGSFNGARVLKPETVALMNQNHTGAIPAGVLKAEMGNLSNDVNFFPGADIRWGLGYMLNLQAGPNGRSAGTVSWGGIFNTYYWLDPAKRVTGLIMTQILPFADARAVALYGRFERGVYDALAAM
jgi:CubicO group peptidase (beta-lactamase class C family)